MSLRTRSRRRRAAVSDRRGGRFGTIFLVMVVAGVAAAAYLGWRELHPRLRGRPEYQLALSDIWISQPPRGIHAHFLEEVQRRSDLPGTVNLLDSDLLEKLSRAFAQHPWVEEVEQARMGPARRVELWLRYRQPVAAVQTPGGLVPVDRHAVRLPRADFSREELAGLPVIRVVPSLPPGPEGAVWAEPLIEGGAQIAHLLQPHWQPLGLEAIEAADWTPMRSDPSHAPSPAFYLISRGGTRVTWGRLPDSDHPGEVSAEEKVERLRNYVSQHGSLEAPDGPYELDIRHWQEISRRSRLSAAQR